MKNSPFDGLRVLDSLLFIEICPADLVRNSLGSLEICLGSRHYRFNCKSREFGELKKLLIEFRRYERGFDLKLEETFAQNIGDIPCLLEKPHDVGT